MDKFRLDGKVALITGASSGIGRETAKLFAQYGAKVFVAARRENRLQELKAEIEAEGGVAEYAICDVSEEENCRKVVADCIKSFGRLDILVNSAGQGDSMGSLEEEFDTAHFDLVIKTDLASVFFMIKYAYPEMEKVGGGSIVNISSTCALRNFGVVAYSAAKGGILSMDRNLVPHFGRLNIRVNSIYPGTIDTEMTANASRRYENFEEMVKSMTPLGRMGQPEEIAYCALYLAADVSSFVTGQAFVVDGGMTC